MTRRVLARLGQPLTALRGVFGNPDLRRLELAWAASMGGWWIYFVALPVYTYQMDGAVAVGLVTGVRLALAAVAAPFVAVLGDRYDRSRVMLGSDLVRAVAFAASTALAVADAPSLTVYALACVISVASTAFHPAQAALLPALARTPDELTAANVASATIVNLTGFVGPAIGGLLVAVVDPGSVFGITAVTMLLSALLIARIEHRAVPTEAEPEEVGARSGGALREAFAGFAAVRGHRRLQVLLALQAGICLTAGSLSVFVVVLAIEELDIGDAGVGYLNAAISVGGLIGAVAAAALVGGRRLAAGFALGAVLWGLPLVIVGLIPEVAIAVVLLAVLGVGDSLVEVAGMTLLQRSVPDEVMARVFGVLESLVVASLALGAVLTPALIGAVGTQAALVITGLVLPLATALAWRSLRAIDREAPALERQLALLRATSIFAPLPEVTLEQLAGQLEPVEVAAGTAVLRQGEAGDRFYLVDRGELEASADGRPGAPLAAGDFFGEIALLRDVPRTATVTARTDSHLFALDRDAFIAAVTGHAPSAAAADAVVATRLGSLRADVGSR